MPVFELEGPDGLYEVDAPDAGRAVAAFKKMQTPAVGLPHRESVPSREQMQGAYREMERGRNEQAGGADTYARTGLRGLARSIPFAEDIAAAGSYAVGDAGSWEEAQDRVRARGEVDDADRPVTSYGSQIAGALALPGGAARGAMTAGKAAMRGAAGGGAYGAAYGAGSGGSLEERAGKAALGAGVGAAAGAAFPLAGAVAGRMPGKAATAAAPDNAALRVMQKGAYKAADDADVIIKPDVLRRLSAEAKEDLAEAAYRPKSQPKIADALDYIDEVAEKGNFTLKGFDTIRKVANNARMDADATTRMMGNQLIKKIDKYFDDLKVGPDILPGIKNPEAAVKAYKDARQITHRLKKSEKIDEALSRAELNAASSGIGGNIDNTTRQQIKNILHSPRQSRGFNAEEKAAMDKVVRGTQGQKYARAIGRFSPETGNLAALFNVGHLYGTGGASLPLSVAGFAAKRSADKSTARNVKELSELVRSGGKKASAPARQLAAMGHKKRAGYARVLAGGAVTARD